MVTGVLGGARSLWAVLRDAAGGWIAHGSPRAAAALAFYALLSLAPTATIGLAISDVFLPDGEARASVVEVAQTRVGPRGARALDWLLERDTGTSSGMVGVAMLLLSATVGFAQLQSALNDAWGVEADPGRPFVEFLRKRALSFVMVLVIGGFLLGVTLFSALFKMVMLELERRGLPTWGWLNIGDFVLGMILTTLLVAAIYRVLPDAEITWRQVVVGASTTALLQGLGRFGVVAYLSRAVYVSGGDNIGEPLMVLLLWTYFSTMIFLFGAEITRVYAERSTGEPIRPARGARRKVA